MKISTLALAIVAESFLLSFAAHADDNFLFTGYARYGAGYSSDDPLYNGSEKNGINIIKTAGSQYQATGRLGNEGNGFEFKLQKLFEQGDMKWDVAVMLDDGYDGSSMGISQAYAGGSGIFTTQPDAYVWAGERFNGREQIDVNDDFYLQNDGTGAGVDNLNVSFAKLDLSIVAGDEGRNGRYALVTQLHDINLTDNQSLRFHFNYGFGSGSTTDIDSGLTTETDDNNAYQLAAIHRITWANGWNETAIRYGDGVRNGILWGNAAESGGSLGAFAYGAVEFTPVILMAYALSFENNTLSNNESGVDEKWTQAVIRPGYRWNDRMSTWLELGYDQVNFGSELGTNASWKTTLSQNIGFGSLMSSRPMLRFYATYGQLNTQYVANGASDGHSDALTFGAMFEAWW